jgi:hypothetical protein
MEIEILDEVNVWEINIENTIREVHLDATPTLVLWYTATGTEGNAITVTGLENKYIIGFYLNRFELEPVTDFPTNEQFSYNVNATFTVAQDLAENDKIKIEYRAIV